MDNQWIKGKPKLRGEYWAWTNDGGYTFIIRVSQTYGGDIIYYNLYGNNPVFMTEDKSIDYHMLLEHPDKPE